MSQKKDEDKTYAEIDADAIEKFNEDFKNMIEREERMLRHFEWRGNKLPPFSIEPMKFERERLEKPMTDEDRRLRKQWLDDQELAPHEPVYIPELYPRNPIRRMFAAPWNAIFNALKPVIGEKRAKTGRLWVPLISMGLTFVYASYYHVKYNPNSWVDGHGWHMFRTRPIKYENESVPPVKQLTDFNDRGFKDRKVLLDLKTSTVSPN